MKMLVRLSTALLFSLLLSVPSHAFLARRAIEHHMMGSAFDAAACKADAARICPGVTDDGQLRQCMKLHQSELSLPCAKEVRKQEIKQEMLNH